MAKVTLFPDPPLGLRHGVRVAASLDYFRDAGAESPVNPREGRPPALILHRVVKKCAGGRILVRAGPRRLCRRVHALRGWSHGTTERVLTGGAGAGGAAGVGAAGRARLAMGGDRIDRGEDRVYGRDAAEVGAAA